MAFYDRYGKKVYYQKLDPSVLDHPAVRKFRLVRVVIWLVNITVTVAFLILYFAGVI